MTKTFVAQMRIPYSDTDAMGVVYHANYAKYFEFGRCEMLREIGFPYGDIEKKGFMMPVASLSCEYKKPAVYDDLLEIHTQVLSYRGASITARYRILRKETGELLATGQTRLAFLRREDGRPVIIKRGYPGLYETMLAQEEPEEAGA